MDAPLGTARSHAAPVATSGFADERPRKNDCVHDELLADGSMVLYHSCLHQIMTLNPTAALVWECCDGAHTLAMLAREVRAVFPDAPDLEADMLALLQQLIEHGMIVDDAL